MSKLRWRSRIEAPHHARVAVSGDSVIVTTYGPSRADFLSSHALNDGALRWQIPLDDFVLGNALAGVQLAADPEGDCVYLAQETVVACFAVATGATRWIAQVAATPPFERFTIDYPPRIAGNRLILLSRRSRLVALDRRNGALLFRSDDRDAALDAVVIDNTLISRSSETADVRGHDVATGQFLWKRLMSGPFSATHRLATSIELASRRSDDSVYLVIDATRALLALDAKTGDVWWEQPVSGLASFAIIGTLALVADASSVRGIDLSTGRVAWRHPADGLSLIAPLDGTTALLQLATTTYAADAASGVFRAHAEHRLHEHDGVLDARSGAVVLSTDGGTPRWMWRDAAGFHDIPIGDSAARPGTPAAHVVTQAILTADGVVTYNTAHELARFIR